MDDIGVRVHHYYPPDNEEMGPDSTIVVDIVAAGESRTLWLQQNDGWQKIPTAHGLLEVFYGQAHKPLGFSLALESFHRGTNPGGVGNATYSSVVHLVDPHKGVDRKQEISMNRPLTYKGMTFYQVGFDERDFRGVSSTLMVSYSPGRAAIYAGCLLICCGIALMFYMRAHFFKQVSHLWNTRSSRPGTDGPSIPLHAHHLAGYGNEKRRRRGNVHTTRDGPISWLGPVTTDHPAQQNQYQKPLREASVMRLLAAAVGFVFACCLCNRGRCG